MLSATSIGTYSLTSYDGQPVDEVDSISLRIVGSGATALRGDSCSSVIEVDQQGALLRDGLGSAGCFIDFPQGSKHLNFLSKLQSERPSFEVEGNTLRVGLYVFNRTN